MTIARGGVGAAAPEPPLLYRTIRSTQAGDWSDTATWVGGVVPTNGDTVVVTHDVVVDVNVTIGRSGPSGNPRIAGPTAVDADGGGASGGELQTESYYVFLVAKKNGGVFSPKSELSASFAVTLGEIPRITLPALPTGADAFDLYVAPGLGEWGYLYASDVTTATYDLAVAYTTTTLIHGYFPDYLGLFDLNVAAGTLEIAAGKTLTVRGSTYFNNSGSATTLLLNAGSSFVIDGTQNTAERYGLFMWRNGFIEMAGTALSRTTIKSLTSGGAKNGYITTFGGAHDGSGIGLDCEYATFSDLGTAAIDAVSGGFSVPHLVDVLFERCGRVNLGGSETTGAFEMSEVTFRNTLHATTCFFSAASNGGWSGSNYVRGCVFDKQASLPWSSSLIVGQSGRENIFLGGAVAAGSYSGGGPLSHSLFRGAFFSNASRYGDWSDVVLINDGSTLDLTDGTYSAVADVNNPHWINPTTTGTDVTDCVVEDFGSTDDGDVDYGPNGTGLNSHFSRVIGVSQVGDNPGTMVTFNGWDGCASTYEHCTWLTSQQSAVALAEAGNGYEGMLASLKSNIFWRRTSGSQHVVHNYSGTPVTDMGFAADMDYNCMWNMGTDYNTPTTDTPGANDISANPQFVDSNRNFSTWVTSIEGATLPGNATPSRTDYNAWGLYKLSLRNLTSHADYDAAYTVAAYLAYVREGFRPTNEALRDAAHDGTDIGAVQMT